VPYAEVWKGVTDLHGLRVIFSMLVGVSQASIVAVSVPSPPMTSSGSPFADRKVSLPR
jgi:hypothetical protein